VRERLFVILGGQNRKKKKDPSRPLFLSNGECPDTEKLNKSPCLSCDLFERGLICPYVDECSRIDEFQKIAATHCTLAKYRDFRSMF
jgi:hypothetical protein